MNNRAVRLTATVIGMVAAVPVAVSMGLWVTGSAKKADAAETPAKTTVPKIVRLHIASDSVYTTCVELSPASVSVFDADNGNAGKWEVAAYRISADDKTVEHYATLGLASKISDTQLVIEIPDTEKARLADGWRSLTSPDPLKRHALVLLPQGSRYAKNAYQGKAAAEFGKDILEEVKGKGMFVFPVLQGVAKRATGCKCAGFFGGTTCCTSASNCTLSSTGACPSSSGCRQNGSCTEYTSCSCQWD